LTELKVEMLECGKRVKRREAEDDMFDSKQLARDSRRCSTQPRLTCMMQ
jgi:hypothetical protein